MPDARPPFDGKPRAPLDGPRESRPDDPTARAARVPSSSVTVSTHPLVEHKVTQLRDRTTEPIRFRSLVTELSTMLVYEATRDLELASTEVETPLTTTTGGIVGSHLGLVPVLRAGLGMVEGALHLLPHAQVWHLGLRRDESSLDPVAYYARFPERPTVDVCLILDPMLATGGSAASAVQRLKCWGVDEIKFVCILAAPEGIAALEREHPDVAIHVGTIDERLTDATDAVPPGFIWPGLGDAGDRQFATDGETKDATKDATNDASAAFDDDDD